MGKKLRVTQIKSSIGKVKRQKMTLKALGLKRVGQTVIHNDSPAVIGMVEAVGHLVKVEEVTGVKK